MTTLKQPRAELETKWGTLTVTFLDPDILTGKYHYDSTTRTNVLETSDRVCHVQGQLTINGVAINVSDSYKYAKVFYHKGKELDTPVIEFTADWNGSYNRRADDQFKDIPPGARSVLHSDLPAVVREFYEANPKLQTAAKLYERCRTVERASQIVEDRRAELAKAETELENAKAELQTFSKTLL